MRVIGTPMGLVISFKSRAELAGVIKHLQDHLEWVDKEGEEPPYFYSMYDDRIPGEEIQDMLQNMKENIVLVRSE